MSNVRPRMQAPSLRVIGVYSPAMDKVRYETFVAAEVDRQNPINFSENLKSFLRSVGRGTELNAFSAEDLQERRDHLEREFAGAVQVEVLVENPDERFSVSDFQQVNPAIPSAHWQVAWNEAFLSADGLEPIAELRPAKLPSLDRYRIAFFIHHWQHELGLSSSYGPLSLLPLTPIPERLWEMAPFELVD